jgi:DNA-binding ferritin-like protein
MLQEFINLIIKLRIMQLYYHNCHNLVQGPTFFVDHEAFGGFYGDLEGCYDGAVERAIGTISSDVLDMNVIMPAIHSGLVKLPGNKTKIAKDFFNSALALEKELCGILNAYITSNKFSQGTVNFFADMADKSEVRQYKINQRIKV